MKKIIAFLLAALATSPAWAVTRYVTDQCEITLRAGESTGHKVVRVLSSGTALEVLKTNKTSGYTRVRTPKGTKGWALTRLLVDTPVAREQLDETRAKLTALQKKYAALSGEVSTLAGDRQSSEQARGEVASENVRLSEELAQIKQTAASAIMTANENRQLKERIIEMERSVQTLQLENASFKDNTARDWFMVGAGAIVLGILIGLIVPRMRFGRKSSWDTF